MFIILSVLFIIIFIKSNGYVKFNYAKKLFAIFSFYFCNLFLRLNPITLDDVKDDASNNPNNNSNKTNNSNETKDNSNNNNKVEAYANAKKVVKDAIDAIGKVVESGLGQAAAQIGLSGSIGAAIHVTASGANKTINKAISNMSASTNTSANTNTSTNTSKNLTEDTPPSPIEDFIHSPNEEFSFKDLSSYNPVELWL